MNWRMRLITKSTGPTGRTGVLCAWMLWGLSLVWTMNLGAEEARVVVISPHNEAIRQEFGRGYAVWHQRQWGEPAVVEWRDLGGSSDALRFVLSEYTHKPGGIDIDCFFGGGLEPFLLLANRGLAAEYVPASEILDGIPQNSQGIEVYDPAHHWYGAALSCFGILQSLRIQHTMGLPTVRTWDDLAQPAVLGWVGAGDPRNSGSMATMFETLLQAYGWEKGWVLLTRMGGNVRKFDRFSSTTAKDVTLGETAYAMAIDFYAFTQVAAAGRTNLAFTMPVDVTALVPDGIAILKGAPHLVEARRFVDFVLSDAGQKLWYLPKGHPEGAQRHSIERMPVRPALYRQYADVSNIQFSPFDLKQSFHFDGQLARKRAQIVAALVGCLLVDTHTELQAAWQAVIRRGLLPEEVARLGQAPLTSDEALALAAGPWDDASLRNHKKLEWQRWARDKYRSLR